MQTPSEWTPDYPTPAARAYRDDFVAGASANGLTGIPDNILSWAIDRAIAARAEAWQAGRTFSDVYFRVATRREPRGGYGSPTAYLMAAYENELVKPVL